MNNIPTNIYSVLLIFITVFKVLWKQNLIQIHSFCVCLSVHLSVIPIRKKLGESTVTLNFRTCSELGRSLLRLKGCTFFYDM